MSRVSHLSVRPLRVERRQFSYQGLREHVLEPKNRETAFDRRADGKPPSIDMRIGKLPSIDVCVKRRQFSYMGLREHVFDP